MEADAVSSSSSDDEKPVDEQAAADKAAADQAAADAAAAEQAAADKAASDQAVSEAGQASFVDLSSSTSAEAQEAQAEADREALKLAAEAEAAADARAAAVAQAAADAKAAAKRQKEIELGKKYKISVKTGNDGTDANIFIVLYGRNAQSVEKKLEKSKEHPLNKFEKGATDTFALRFKEKLGPITHVKVRSDCAGLGARWQLASVAVFDAEWTTFEYNAALDTGKKYCFLPALTPKEQIEMDGINGYKLNKGLFGKRWDARGFCVRGSNLFVARARVPFHELTKTLPQNLRPRQIPSS